MSRKAYIALVALSLACSDYNEGPPAETGSIQIAVNPTAVTITPGTSGSVGVALTRAGGFTGDVVVAVAGLPAGITPTVTPIPLTATATTATVGLAVAAGVAAGTYNATITATGQGVTQATGTLQITVPPAPGFSLAIVAGGISVATGGVGEVGITLQRTNFTGPIELSLLNPPVGVTATFTPSSTTANTALLTLIVNPTATHGVIPLIIRASAPGMADRTATFDLTIRAPAAATRVEYQFCDPAAAPVFVAFQDGGGAWQPVTASALGSQVNYAFDIAAGRGGVMMVFKTSVAEAMARNKVALRREVIASRVQANARRSLLDVYETYIIYGTTNELVQDGIETCGATVPTKTIRAPVAGVPVGSYAFLSLTGATEIFDPATDPNPVVLTGVSSRTNDFVAARTVPGNAPDRIIIMRNTNLPDGASLPTIDFNAASALIPATAQVTVSGQGNDNLEAFVDLITPNGHHGLWSELTSGPAPVRPWAGLRPSDMMSSEFHALIVFASPQNQNGDFRVTQRYVDFVTNQTLALGPSISLPNISQASSGTYPRLRFQGALPAEYDRGVAFSAAPDSGSGNFFSVAVTTAYLRAAGNGFTYDVVIPDLTALPNFPLASGLSLGATAVEVDAWGFNGPGAINPLPVRGGEFRAAVRNTTVTIQ